MRANNNYFAYVPDLPGYVATSDTNAKREIQEAIRFHLDATHEDGSQLPMPSSVVDGVQA